MHCKVGYCRYNYTHVTKGHKCGRCGIYGHGDYECLHPRQIDMLIMHHNDVLPDNMKCSVSDCIYKELHTVDAHHCSSCGRRTAHTLIQCNPIVQNNNKTYYKKCPLCRTDNTLVNPKKILGLSDKCSICMDDNVEILFPDCSHVCVCNKCFDKLQ